MLFAGLPAAGWEAAWYSSIEEIADPGKALARWLRHDWPPGSAVGRGGSARVATESRSSSPCPGRCSDSGSRDPTPARERQRPSRPSAGWGWPSSGVQSDRGDSESDGAGAGRDAGSGGAGSPSSWQCSWPGRRTDGRQDGWPGPLVRRCHRVLPVRRSAGAGKAQPKSAERMEWIDTRNLPTSRGDRGDGGHHIEAISGPDRLGFPVGRAHLGHQLPVCVKCIITSSDLSTINTRRFY